jgi:hypothetical protein
MLPDQYIHEIETRDVRPAGIVPPGVLFGASHVWCLMVAAARLFFHLIRLLSYLLLCLFRSSGRFAGGLNPNANAVR